MAIHMHWHAPVHVYGQSDRCWTAIVMVSMSVGLHCLLVGVIVHWHGGIVKFWKPGKTAVYSSRDTES